MRSDRKPLLAFLASGPLFVQFLLTAFGPFDVDKPRPSDWLSGRPLRLLPCASTKL
jgi:hypothetical protein